MECSIEVPEFGIAFIDAALVRLGYLHPNLTLSRYGDRVVVLGAKEAELPLVRQNILHAIYREKIYTETLPLRRQLFASVLS